MLSDGNTKLGKVHSWSIPAIKTCPGRSSICEQLCYADSGFYHMPNVIRAHNMNLHRCRTRTWVSQMVREIHDKKVRTLRVHAAGDFFDVTYIRRWQQIVARCPAVQFYAYTRSWQIPVLLDSLVDLAHAPNFHMWWSWDAAMPEPPQTPGVRICWLARTDDDLPPRKVDLVFRADTEQPLKILGESRVCPVEQNVVGTSGQKPAFTCQTCALCFRNRQPASQPVD